MTLDQDSALCRAFGRQSGEWKSRTLVRRLWTVRGLRAGRLGGHSAAVVQAAWDGCACAQADLDDHGLGTRPEGVVEALRSLPALTGIVALGVLRVALPSR